MAVSSTRRSEVVVVKAEQVQLQRDGGVFSAGDHHGAVLALILNHQHTDAVTEI